MNDVDKPMALHDDCIAARENPQCSYLFEQQKRQALRAAIVEALDRGEPTGWIAHWAYQDLVSGIHHSGPVQVWADPNDKTGLVPFYAKEQP